MKINATIQVYFYATQSEGCEIYNATIEDLLKGTVGAFDEGGKYGCDLEIDAENELSAMRYRIERELKRISFVDVCRKVTETKRGDWCDFELFNKKINAYVNASVTLGILAE